MKILIFSDSHLHDEVFTNIIEYQNPDKIICLGDLGNKINPILKDAVIVKGNNDFADLPNDLVYEYDGHTAYLCHGHYLDVENGLERLVKKAKELNCDTALYGHTHQPVDQIIDGIHIINPGSIMFPRNGKILIPTYCIYEDGKYSFYHSKKNTLEDLWAEVPKKKKEKPQNNEEKVGFFASLIAWLKSLFAK